MKFEDFKDHVKAEDPKRFGMVYLTLNNLTGDYGKLVGKEELEQLFKEKITSKTVSLELNLSLAVVMNLADHYGIQRIRRTTHG